MTRRPVIGLPGRRKRAADFSGFPATLDDLDIDMYLADYSRAIVEAGGLPLHLPMVVDPGDVIGLLDGILLTGGADVDPGRYGAEVHPETLVETERDRFELALLDAAENAGLAVLGVCRGLQLINVARGGSLNQHVPEHARYDVAPDSLVHDVSFADGSVCRGLYGPSMPVNSLHHQTVNEVGAGLTATGVGDDGVVEALEGGPRLVAVQWHPEMLATRPTDPVFDWLVTASLRD